MAQLTPFELHMFRLMRADAQEKAMAFETSRRMFTDLNAQLEVKYGKNLRVVLETGQLMEVPDVRQEEKRIAGSAEAVGAPAGQDGTPDGDGDGSPRAKSPDGSDPGGQLVPAIPTPSA